MRYSRKTARRCAAARYAHQAAPPRLAGGHRTQRGRPRGPEGRHAAAPRAGRGPRSPAADLPGGGPGRSPESPRRRADAGGRGDPSLCAESRVGASGGRESRHEQKQRQPAIRGEDHGAAPGVAIRTAGRPRPRERYSSTVCILGTTASWWPSGSPRMARNTRSAYGRAPPRTPRCVRACWRICRAGVRTDRSLLVILDGAQALHKATRAVFGEAALIQRCQVHKLRNILDHLPERQRPWVQAIVRRAYRATDVKMATRLLTNLAQRLDEEYPSAAGSVREGLEETLTVLTLHLSARLPAIAHDDERRRESAEPHPPREAEREAVAWRTDDAAVGGCRRTRSREGLSSAEGMRRYAPPRHRPPRTRPTARPGGLSGEGRVESHPSRRRISTAVGTSPHAKSLGHPGFCAQAR